jgi:hypothetical protein
MAMKSLGIPSIAIGISDLIMTTLSRPDLSDIHHGD